MFKRSALPYLFLAASAYAALTPAEALLTDSIRADSLRGHLSFLASDLLEGRDTPSRGLSITEEYIAAQFRRLGLQPAGDNGTYFQNAAFLKVTQARDSLRINIEVPGGKAWESTGDKISVSSLVARQRTELEVFKIFLAEDTPLPSSEAVAGKAVILQFVRMTREIARWRSALLDLQPAIVLTPGPVSNVPYRLREAGPAVALPPLITTSDSAFAELAAALPDGATGARLTFQIPPPIEEPITVRNVAARLPGSDPALNQQTILLTAHHDHLGLATRGDGDRIFNGANDDASGVATVLVLAEAFSAAPVYPRRSLLFVTFSAEEKGLLGSRYYAAHPLVPLKNTVANLNFEQMGRTDDNEGPRLKQLIATGFDYTTMADVLAAAGRDSGVQIAGHTPNSDLFFAFADNKPLADAGVPALTFSVAFEFPDYHRPGDHWEKIVNANMQSVVRSVAVGVCRLAAAAEPPAWLPDNPKTEPFRKAYQTLHSSGK